MYLLQKYDALSGLDHAEFISKDVPPWHVSHDTCGPQPEPPAARKGRGKVGKNQGKAGKTMETTQKVRDLQRFLS